MDAVGVNQRRRIVRTLIASAWDAASVITKEVPSNTGLAQHQIYVGSTTNAAPSAGRVTVMVRPAKAKFYVPIGMIGLTLSGSGEVMFPAIIDAVSLVNGISSTSGAYEAGILSVSDDFTASHDQSDIDRRRFGEVMVATNWNGTGTVSAECKDQSGFTQHQLAIAGGTGTVKLLGRPVSGSVWVDINYGTRAIDASGSLVIFPGMYDAFMLVPVGTLTGSIQAQAIGVGEEMFFQPYPSRTVTGAKAGNAALTSLIAALAADQIIIDSTT